ncbi:MAG: hypothetical protein ACE5FN_10945, partial [Leptospirillia bacterium]
MPDSAPPLSPIRPVYLIHGAEAQLRSEALAAVCRAALDPELADFNEDRFEAASATTSEVVAAAQTLPVPSRTPGGPRRTGRAFPAP